MSLLRPGVIKQHKPNQTKPNALTETPGVIKQYKPNPLVLPDSTVQVSRLCALCNFLLDTFAKPQTYA